MGEQLYRSEDGKSLNKEAILKNFGDLHLPLNPTQARAESARCLFCHDAPCIKACPTSIDIPGFIRQISTGNTLGSAKTILDSNIMGGTCARVCPTEILCEGACVYNKTGEEPIQIGQLQRHAVDHLMKAGVPHPYSRAKETGKNVAVIGAGPAGLACAHALAQKGHRVQVFEKRAKPGGLNEYGIAAYKMVDDFAQKEVEFLLEVGGVSIDYGRELGEDLLLSDLRADYDAVFIGLGLCEPRALRLKDTDLEQFSGEQVQNALDFIEEIRQAEDKSQLQVGERVIVIGGGNTAIDAAVQAKRLGAREVTMAYRRGAHQMGATQWEQELAKTNDVRVLYWLSPESIASQEDGSLLVRFEQTELQGGNLQGTGEYVSLAADQVLSAIGQSLSFKGSEQVQIQGGKIFVNQNYETTVAGVFAGGDCIKTGEDLTVQAVEDGKNAAQAIHSFVMEENHG
jgi:dihydropyrimidine dehydrogenase (NAD+) subunit PreT